MNALERRLVFMGLTLLVLTCAVYINGTLASPTFAQTRQVSPRCVVDPSGQCYPPTSYFGADLSLNGKMQQATGISSNSPSTRPNGPWPQNAQNYCFLAAVQGMTNYADLDINKAIQYPNRSDEGPVSGNPNDETSGQILYDMDHLMQPTFGTLDIHGSGASRSPFTLADSSHDFGGDPRSQSEATYVETPGYHYYHQYIYHNGVMGATLGLGKGVAAAHSDGTSQEPVIAFVNHAEHVVLVAGVWSRGNPVTYQYASIQYLAIYNPWDQSLGSYLSGAYYTKVSYADWVGGGPYPDPYGGSSYWWNYPYKANGNLDPDPYMGIYQAGVDPYLGNTKNPSAHHWIDNYVTVQRDDDSSDSADYSHDENGNVMQGP